jgi:hypothetical protein
MRLCAQVALLGASALFFATVALSCVAVSR